MKYTGKEWSSIQVEENGKPEFCWCNITLYHLLNTGIKSIILGNLKDNENIKKYPTQFITIGDLKLSKGTKVNIKFLISLEEDNYNLYPDKFSAYLTDTDVVDIYNKIVDLFENYACDLDTDIDNVIIELAELEVLKEEKQNGNKYNKCKI